MVIRHRKSTSNNGLIVGKTVSCTYFNLYILVGSYIRLRYGIGGLRKQVNFLSGTSRLLGNFPTNYPLSDATIYTYIHI